MYNRQRSRILLFFPALIMLLAIGCDTESGGSERGDPIVENPSVQTGLVNGSIMHDNLQRSFILYVPQGYTGQEAVPVVFNFHGYTSNAAEQMNYGDFRAIADTAGFLVVHPQGALLDGSTHWNVGGWTLASTIDDVGFTSALLDHLDENYNVDLTRVYSTGMSNGGYMSFLLACQLSTRITAVASVTGSMTPETFRDCDPQHPTPILQIHGTNDNVVPYNGAAWTRSIDDVLSYWTEFNSCTTTANTRDLSNSSTADGSTVDHVNYDCSATDTSVEHYKVSGGGHTWPGTVLSGPGTNQDMDASAEIWKFFSRYAL